MKRFLLFLLTLCTVVYINAFKVDDYLFTHTAKFKVIGDNLVTNGDFSSASNGWTNSGGAEVSALAWQYTPAAGPNGENVLTSMGSAKGNVLARMLELNPGTYSVSYWIKGAEAGGSTLNVPGANYTGVYVNTDASLTTVGRNVADIGAYSMEWMQVNDTVQIAQGEYLVIYFDQMATGVMVTNFEVNEIAQVYDTRIIERELAFIKPLMENTELFPNQGELPDVVGVIEAALAGDTSFGIDFSDPGAIAGVEDFLAQNYYPNKDAFMTNNSGNQLAFISYGDIAGWPKFNNGDGKTSQGDWKFSGTTKRWGHRQNAANGNYAYPGNYDLLDGTAMIEKADMKPGKYLFSLEVQAIKYFKTKINNSYYHPDYTTNMLGGKLFFGKDTVVIDTISNRNYDRVTIISELAEGDTLRAGFYFPGFPVGTGGGEGLFQGAMLRIIGQSDAELALEELVKNIASAQNGLKVMIDSAKAITANPAKYPWGLETLTTAVTANEEFLNETYQFVDADGNNLVLTTDLTDEQNNIPTEINDQMAAMRTAIQNLYGINKPHTDMVDAILYHKAVLADALYASAAAESRANYEYSIANADSLYKTLSLLDSIASTIEAAKYIEAMDLMSDKERGFKNSCASYEAPADLQIKNGDFVNGGKRSKTGAVNDWNLVKGTNYKEHTWPTLTDYAGYEAYGVQTWRGYTAPPQFKMQQVSTVSMPGVYEYRVLGYGYNENNKRRGYYTIVSDEETGVAVDTTFEKSELYYFMGANGAPDSTIFHSQYSDNLTKPSWFSVCYVKESADPEELEYGMDGNRTLHDGMGPNCYMMGAARLFYCGDVESYRKAIYADLAAEVAKAQVLIDANLTSPHDVCGWLVVKLKRYIADAATATTFTQQKNIIHRLKETISRLEEIEVDSNEIQGVVLNKETANVIEGDTVVLIATVLPSTAVAEVVWSTSDASVATVDNGVVTALKAGTATITATAGDKSASCEIIVESKPVSNAYSFVVNDVVLRSGESMLYPVALDNQDSVSAFQCDVYLPEGITLQTKKSKYDITLDENRVDDHTVTSSVQPDGAIRMVVASLTSSDFIGNSGNLFYLNLLVAEGISGELPISIKNIHVSESNGTRHDLADVSAIINVPAYTPGDVNNDGLLMVDDIVMTINYILGDVSENFVFVAADMNSDNQIMIDDVVSVINAILGVSSSKQHFADNAFGSETLTLRDCGFKNGKSEFGLSLSNASNYSALQFDLRLPSGVTLDDIVVTSSSNHVVSFREVGAGVVRAVVASLDNEPFSGADQLLVRVNAPMPSVITVINGFASTATSKLVGISESSVHLNGGTTGIESLGVSSTPSNIYDLSGRLVKHNATSTDGLRKGVYMMNGKKLIIE